MAKKGNIKCPHCGAEYLAAEIFYPDSLLGRPEDIIKNDDGIILGFNGPDMNTYETFQCERCNKKFSVEMSVSFKTAPLVDVFDEEF